MIQLEHLTRRFGQKTAVDDISVNIKDGCITGFIGPNGAGKTTTIHMMTGVLEPSEGSVLINGISLKEKPIEAKKQFALVPDSPDLFVRLSAREYVQLLCAIYETDPKRAEENEALALRVGKSFITECWWKILPSVASLAVWGVHRFRMATRV